MRLAIQDIMTGAACTEKQAELIEDYINENQMLDWSECDVEEINMIAQYAKKELKI